MAVDASQNRQWYTQVDGTIYGPFSDETLWSYMQEGRITPQSFISQNPQGNFRALASDPGLSKWLSYLPDSSAAEDIDPAPLETFLVMGEIRSGRGMAFLQSLQALGSVQRCGDTVWLLTARANADDIRDALCSPLAPEDRVLVVAIGGQDLSAFNLGRTVDAALAAMKDEETDGSAASSG